MQHQCGFVLEAPVCPRAPTTSNATCHSSTAGIVSVLVPAATRALCGLDSLPHLMLVPTRTCELAAAVASHVI
jgi:hypothetical protein